MAGYMQLHASVPVKAPVPLPICPLCLVPFGLIYKTTIDKLI
jgi:hypothetical protein